MEALIIGGFFTVFILNSILGWGVRALKWIPALFAFYGWWLLMWASLFKYQGGAWSQDDQVTKANAGLAVIMILISAINKPVAPSVAAGGLIGMAFSILTG